MCETKVRHATREEALDHIKALVWNNHVRGRADLSAGLSAYPCDIHACWHVGHQDTLPLIWHYTIVEPYLERILTSDKLKPSRPRRPSQRMLSDLSPEGRAYALAFCAEPKPLLWFSRNPEWEYSVRKVMAETEDHDRHIYTGRAMTELLGQGLVRFGVSASLAKLRWSDYLARNPTTQAVRRILTRYGNPTEWLATDEAIPLDRVKAIQVYYRGAWRHVAEVSDDDFATYLAGRPAAYRAAQARLKADGKHRALSDAEQILVSDEKYGNAEFV